MNISYKWLKRYIDFEYDPHTLAAALTSLGLECDTVEEVESIRGGLKGLVIGKVLTCTDHPDSDHLHITTVDVGKEEPLQIVCGAPNVAAGQTVVVATVGTTLYDGDKEFQIKKSKIRGVQSFGMICAEDEIGVGSSHDGIIVIDDDIIPGTPASTYYNVESDYMLEVELTPNRVDAASHYGTARDLKALLARLSYDTDHNAEIPQIHTPDISTFHSDTEQGATPVEILDTEGCIRYSGVRVKGVKVSQSPEWLQRLLIAAGQRPINNIVDITNFVLLGLGQPLHCFDLAKVEGDKIVVRTCEQGTKFTTLDGVERTLDQQDLMICDVRKPLCIAGVFGGLDSGVTEDTKDVFIESACFHPTRIRKTARRHALSTDASFRYERGTDPNITVKAAKLAAILIKELAGGEICGDISDFYPNPVSPFRVELSLDYCAKLIGKEIPQELIRRILTALEIEILPQSTDETLILDVPTYRVDVTRPCDVVEEILRVYGYNNVEFDTEMHINLSEKKDTDFSYDMQEKVANSLTAQGFYEILNNSLTAEKYYNQSDLLPISGCVKLLNPLSNELSVMRRTLLFGGLESISHNLNRKFEDIKFYEFGNIYNFDPQKESTVESPLLPYSEQSALALWITGKMQPESWTGKGIEATFYDLKGIVLNILKQTGININEIEMSQLSDEFFSAKLSIATKSGKQIGEMGILRSSLLKKFDIEQPVLYAQILWNNLYRQARRHSTLFAPIPKTMPVRRDLALLLDKATPFAAVEACVRKADRKLLRDVTLFDVYEGKNLPEGKKSYAIAITLQDNEKTLNDKQIDAVMKKVVTSLEKELSAQLR
ncbi:MAG: phenylalanine--tRNA ligase subunit beta [Prevotella sp.]|nr:phenylalanine--tRNA ligase subunit beta [Bacteroides sp.]MCM1366980.1 phenylalanine--tRNA ligase subunit beta [Prevotella sp.]MCM1437489.1 phenylalanine--tRNA ligase subunit beta [Prevotella sp.]